MQLMKKKTHKAVIAVVSDLLKEKLSLKKQVYYTERKEKHEKEREQLKQVKSDLKKLSTHWTQCKYIANI